MIWLFWCRISSCDLRRNETSKKYMKKFGILFFSFLILCFHFSVKADLKPTMSSFHDALVSIQNELKYKEPQASDFANYADALLLKAYDLQKEKLSSEMRMSLKELINDAKALKSYGEKNKIPQVLTQARSLSESCSHCHQNFLTKDPLKKK